MEPITLVATTDYATVHKIVTDRRVYARMVDDQSPAIKEYRLPTGPTLNYFLVYEGVHLLGMILLDLRTPIMFEIHACFLPIATGARSTRALFGILDWVWQATWAERVITTVPDFNKAALHKAKRIGMSVYGINERAFRKNGTFGSQILLGINREATPCPS